jgi:glycosyltransferase involved in cell wall biosynthesis
MGLLNHMEKVLVYLQAHNAEKTLTRAVNSILNQTYCDWELHLVENGSSDNTGDIVSEYAIKSSKIIPVFVKENSWKYGYSYLTELFNKTEAKWFCLLDADDEYDLRFFEKMLCFTSDNDLDIASAGYSMVDESTGKQLKYRGVAENVVLSGSGFAGELYLYRWSTCMHWNHLFSVDLMKEAAIFKAPAYVDYNDCITVLNAHKHAEKIGILADTLYTYYFDGSTLSRRWKEDRIEACMDYFMTIKSYLTHFGELSGLNEDLLFSLLLHMHEESVEKLKAADIPFQKKIVTLDEIFSVPETQEMLRYKSNSQHFHNLAKRKRFVCDIRDWLLAQTTTASEERDVAYTLLQYLNSIPGYMPCLK